MALEEPPVLAVGRIVGSAAFATVRGLGKLLVAVVGCLGGLRWLENKGGIGFVNLREQ